MSKAITAVGLLIMLCLSISAPAADDLGRLFTTPAERSSLDYLRQTTKAPAIEEPSQATLESAPIAPAIPESISMQGYVKRSDGKKGTVWVNNHPMEEDSANGEVEVGKLGRDGNEVKLKVPATGKDFNLKAGQVYSPGSGTVEEQGAHAKGSSLKPATEGVIDGTEPSNNNSVK